MTTNHSEATPVHGSVHDALSVFLGEWRAEGTSFGGTDQSGIDPKANGVPWVSAQNTRRRVGESFMLQDERAQIAGTVFDTPSILGVEPSGKDCFARTFDNNGFYRDYGLSVDDRTWLLEGATERARMVFDADGDTQTIAWEWLQDER